MTLDAQVAQLKAGIYRDVAGMQGNDRTFYVGGATDFELVEPIVEHRSTSSRSTLRVRRADASRAARPGTPSAGRQIRLSREQIKFLSPTSP